MPWSPLRHEASVAALYVNLIPVVGLFFEWIAGEPTGAIQLIGGAIAIIGVLIGDIAVRHRVSEPQSPSL